MSTNLVTQKIENLSQVEILREIYNLTREDLATKGPLPYKTQEEQEKWWKNLDHKKTSAWLVYLDHQLVGFILLTDRGTFVTPVMAILPSQQGKGLGRKMVQLYLSLAEKPLAGSQLVENKKICWLNQDLGWIVISERENVELLMHWNGFDMPYTKEEVDAVIRDVREYHEL